MRWLCLLFFMFPAAAFAGEDCSQMGGTCRDACSLNEEAVKGAFLDCTEKQECCIPKETPKGIDMKPKNDGKKDEQKPQRSE